MIDSDHVNSPRPTPRDTTQPPLPLSTLCCRAIEALGGKATLGQIRRWLTTEYEWYKVNDGWQVTTGAPIWCEAVSILTKLHRRRSAACCLPIPCSTRYDEKKTTRAKIRFTRSDLESLETNLAQVWAVTVTQWSSLMWKEMR